MPHLDVIVGAIAGPAALDGKRPGEGELDDLVGCHRDEEGAVQVVLVVAARERHAGDDAGRGVEVAPAAQGRPCGSQRSRREVSEVTQTETTYKMIQKTMVEIQLRLNSLFRFGLFNGGGFC